MSFISSLLASKIGQAQGKTLGEDLIDIIAVIAMIFGGLVTLYALYLAYAMATASDAGKRAEAKKRVINSVAIVLIIIALVGVLKIVGMRGNSVVPQGDWVISYTGDGPYTVTLGVAPGVEFKNSAELLNAATWTIVGNPTGWKIEKTGGGNATLTKGETATAESVTVNCMVNGQLVKVTVP